MSASRVCIQADRNGDPVAVDVVLPSGTRVGELLPAILELIDGRPTCTDTARRWNLQRPSGGALDQSLSLLDNGVLDGELLILDADGAPPLGPVRRTPCGELILAPPVADHRGEFLAGTACVLTTTVAAAVLASTAGSGLAMLSAVIAAVGAIAAAAATIATGYPTAASLAAVTLTFAAGFLAVPSGPAAPNVFLAATAALSTSLLLLRLRGRPSPALTAGAALSSLVAAVTLASMPLAMMGAALSTAALALLAAAPRLAVLAAGLGPDRRIGAVTESAVAGHALLSGLVAGCAAGVASGAVLVAVAAPAVPDAGTAFTGLLGAVLLLRSRTYADPHREIALFAGASVCVAACVHIAVNAHREVTGPVACALVVIGLIVVRRPGLNAAVARLLDRIEYVALAAVVPVACWVGGVYTAVGGFGLR